MAKSRFAPPSGVASLGGQPRRFMAPGIQGAMQYASSHGLDPNQQAAFAAQMRDLQSPSPDPAVIAQAAQIQQQAIQNEREARLRQQQLSGQQRTANDANDIRRGQLNLDARRSDIDARSKNREMEIRARGDDRRMRLSEIQEGKRFSDTERTQQAWEVQSASVLEKDAAEMLKAARGIEYTPEGRRMFSQLAAEGKAILAARSTLRPAAFSQMMGKWMEKFESSDLPSFQVEPPNIKDVLSRTFTDIGNGMGAVLDKDGVPQFRKIVDSEFAKAASMDANGNPQIATPEERLKAAFSGPKNTAAFQKAYKEAETALQSEWSSKPENADALMPPSMDPAEVRKKMQEPFRQQYEFEREMLGLGGTQPPMVAEPPVEQEEMPPAAGAPPIDPYSGTIKGPGFFSDLKDQYSRMAGMFTPGQQAPQGPPANPNAPDPVALKSREEADLEYFSDEGNAKIRELFDADRGGKRNEVFKNKAFRALEEAVKGAELPSHPARYIDRRAVDRLSFMGSKDPIGDAAKSVADAIKEKGRHFALMSPMEQEALGAQLDIYDPVRDADAIKALKPGTYYMDNALRIYRVPPSKKTMLERAGNQIPDKVQPDVRMFQGRGF
jgi:hypothetical protein